MPGGSSENSIGTLKTGELTMKSGSKVIIKVTNPQKDMLVVSGALKLENVHLQVMQRGGAAFAEGDSIIIFSATKGISVTGEVTVASFGLPESLTWDVSGIATSGSIKVAQKQEEPEQPEEPEEPEEPTGVDAPLANPLAAWSQSGTLYVSGLTAGKPWQVYSISGTLVHQSIATADKEEVGLNLSDGMYIVVQEKNRVKVLLR